jgi:DNA-binding MarR family transcriptional regulator
MKPSPQTCAADLLEIVPLIMRAMRAEVRRQRTPELSMPQFRALAFVGRNEGAALSDVAAFLGLGLPSASKLIDGLVGEKWVIRETAVGDRRRVELTLSPEGQAKYKAMTRQAQRFLAGKVAHFTETQCQQASEVLTALRQTFEIDPPSEVVRQAARIKKPLNPTNEMAPHVSKKPPVHV